MKLILIRHGETEENIRKVFPDRLLGQLTEIGEEQAKTAGQKLKDITPTATYCSVAKRCKRTLQIIIEQANWKTQITTDDRIMERNYGLFVGQPTSALSREKRDSDTPENDKMGMERHADVRNRVKQFIGFMKEKYGETDTVVAVGHGDPMVWMCAIICDLSYSEAREKFKVKNGEAIEFTL